MPINYLNLQPQIKDYCKQAKLIYKDRPQKINQALDLLHRCADVAASRALQDIPDLTSSHPNNRCARPGNERVDQSYELINKDQYAILASDGSQIISNHHDALPISLINTSGIFYQPNSGKTPEIQIVSKFIRNDKNAITLEIIPEDLVNMARDVAEAGMLANFHLESDLPIIALSDGPLELFHQPRASADHQRLFQTYLQALDAIYQSGRILGGYIDKPRADLVIRMLEMIFRELKPNLVGISDADIFSRLLKPGSRSAIFQLNSPSSGNYTGPLALRFFYLNVGRKGAPWIVRVEINKWSADNLSSVRLLHQALLDQCLLMGSQPYPYILHRAHEEAVVHFDEKEKLAALLSFLLQQSGAETGNRSYKSSTKQLQKRTRMK
ncbi:MAG: DNA double-strand break repair nuclease NurA [Anaerolineaceae bacterium]|nr:DNA double-strand break repair nuclease NurA [Anaerolineaceae bacterium]